MRVLKTSRNEHFSSDIINRERKLDMEEKKNFICENEGKKKNFIRRYLTYISIKIVLFTR